MHDSPSIHRLRDTARYMALDYRPSSPEAHELSRTVAETVFRAGSGRNRARRGANQQRFERAAAAFAADLLKAAQGGAHGWSYRNQAKSSFNGEIVSARAFKQLRDGALAAGLIEKKRGYCDRIDWGEVESRSGLALRLRAKENLLTLAERCGITPANVDQHFQRAEPIKPLVLKSSSTRLGGRKQSGRSMRFDETATTRRLRDEIIELNKFLTTQRIEGGIHHGYRRIFNQGDRPAYAWNKGGRLYSIGEENYQTLKKHRRLDMTINGEPVVEIDIRASYLTILHALKNRPFDPSSDPYMIPELHREGLPRHVLREVAKSFVTMTLGNTTFHRRWPSDKVAEFKEIGINLGRRFPLKDVQRAVLAHLPIMMDWPNQSITCFDLMFIESEAVVGTMLELMKDHRVPSLSVHDSIIIPVAALELATTTLKRRYGVVCGVEPYLTERMSSAAHDATLSSKQSA
jgi:hypothetical protein